jgi:hypothetical protein
MRQRDRRHRHPVVWEGIAGLTSRLRGASAAGKYQQAQHQEKEPNLLATI